ncbi:MAG TPA: outer membrane beta-barrel domain-containing protein [Kofleriaceae bacterium]|nr:outer membrane beta-barrel domain-containing protein [Kofleriaceae bacterium]
MGADRLVGAGLPLALAAVTALSGAGAAAASPAVSPRQPAAPPVTAETMKARAAVAAVAAERPTSICIDQEIADRLAIKRKRRKVVDRLFVKQARHELSIIGGYYVSDLFSSTYAVGASYTYHMTETTAVELGGAITHADAELVRALEGERDEVLEDDFAQVRFFESLLLWTPVYGKLRLGGDVSRFDIHLDVGAGVIDSNTSRGAAGVAGVGFKLFAGRALAFRLDARDHVYRQELLDDRFLVNDLSLTLGLSLFLPLRN